MQYYGFVYLWRDRLRHMSYIGSHVGSTSDSYTGSSTRFKRAYAKRPQDFKRKVLTYVFEASRKALLIEEERWLQMIKPHHLQVRYYNIKRRGTGGFVTEGYNESQRKQHKQNLRQRPGRGKNHYKARIVVCDGVVYDTLTIAKRELGWDPTKRLRSRRDLNFYFQDEGQPSQDEIARNKEQKRLNQRRQIEAMRKKNLELGPEYHSKRVAKSSASRKANDNYRWTKPIDERQGTPVTIDGREFSNLRSASMATGLSTHLIRKRYLTCSA